MAEEAKISSTLAAEVGLEALENVVVSASTLEGEEGLVSGERAHPGTAVWL
jgi:hypothetical protein